MKEPLGAKVITKDHRILVGDIVDPAAPGLLTLERCYLVARGGWYYKKKRSTPLQNVLHIVHGEFAGGTSGWFDADGRPVID